MQAISATTKNLFLQSLRSAWHWRHYFPVIGMMRFWLPQMRARTPQLQPSAFHKRHPEINLLTPLPVDSIAYAYITMTDALGFIPLRHEDKLTGLAGYGESILPDKIAARFLLMKTLEFSRPPGNREIHSRPCRGCEFQDPSASIQQVLESCARLGGFWNSPKLATSVWPAACSAVYVSVTCSPKSSRLMKSSFTPR
jgi:hypothetical protein